MAIDHQPAKYFSCGVRFVGGPWHNRIVEYIERDRVLVPAPVDTSCVPPSGPIERAPAPHAYRLCRFFTGWRDENGKPTLFRQYVHESIPLDALEACEETFPPLDPQIVRTFCLALRGCFFTLRGRHVDGRDDWDWPSR